MNMDTETTPCTRQSWQPAPRRSSLGRQTPRRVPDTHLGPARRPSHETGKPPKPGPRHPTGVCYQRRDSSTLQPANIAFADQADAAEAHLTRLLDRTAPRRASHRGVPLPAAGHDRRSGDGMCGWSDNRMLSRYQHITDRARKTIATALEGHFWDSESGE